MRYGKGMVKIQESIKDILPAQGQMSGGPDLAKVKVTPFHSHSFFACASVLVQPQPHRASLAVRFSTCSQCHYLEFSMPVPSLLHQKPRSLAALLLASSWPRSES